jgi:hypothetical protein
MRYMKIFIGKHPRWIGPYQIASYIVFWDEDKAHKLGRFLSTGSFEEPPRKYLFDDSDVKSTWFNDLCSWVDGKKKRKVDIRVDDYDVWNADSTLALIILPVLKKVKEKKHGAPYVDDDDVPDELKSTSAPAKENDWDVDKNHFRRWDWVLDEMIWAFEQLHPENDWEAQFHTGKIDFEVVPLEDGYTSLKKSDRDTHVFDDEGFKVHRDRIQNGLRLFAKYFQCLWT